MARTDTHLDDDRLMSIGPAGGREEHADALEHLTRCPDCASRLRSLVGFLDADRVSAAEELSTVFPPIRLATQRSRIMRRLDSIGRMARVLDFPDRSSRSEPQGGSGVASRWVAAAAVIGLVAGLGTGLLVDRRFIQRQVSEVRIAPAAGLADDDLLGDIDQALLDSAAPELSAIDAFTPAMHEVVFTSR